MRLKSYFVHSVEDAIQQAKGELGGDAMLVDTKALAAQPGNRARVEVIFAAPTQSPAAPPIAAPTSAPTAIPSHTQTLQRFRGGLTNLLSALSAPPDSVLLKDTDREDPAMDRLQARLACEDVPSRLIGQIVSEGLSNPSDKDCPAAAIASLLASRIPQPALATAEPRRIALIGPTGGGKTTVAAKLAYHLGIAKGIAPLVVSLDNVKIGASDQLSRLCRLLGVAFQPIENPGDLRFILEENAHRRLVLLDTPGLHAGDPDLAGDLATCMSGTVPIERHLVIPASARAATMETWIGHASVLSIGHLLFTRLDETDLFGPMWSLASTFQMPLSWVSLGPRIPEDLEPASVPRLCAAIAGVAAPQTTPRANAARAGYSPS